MNAPLFNKLFYDYAMKRIEIPLLQQEEIFFPVRRDASESHMSYIKSFKEEQIKRILIRYHELRKAGRDNGLLTAMQEWFEQSSNPLFNKYFKDRDDSKMELSFAVVKNNPASYTSHTIIPSFCYTELRNQIQMPMLENLKDDEKTNWGKSHSENFIGRTLESSKIHDCDKCFIFKDLEQKVDEAKKDLGQ